MSINVDQAYTDDPNAELVSELNDEMLERVREVAHSIESRVRNVTIDDLDHQPIDDPDKSKTAPQDPTS